MVAKRVVDLPQHRRRLKIIRLQPGSDFILFGSINQFALRVAGTREEIPRLEQVGINLDGPPKFLFGFRVVGVDR